MPKALWLHNAGLRLAAHFYAPPATPAPGVVICHGFGSRKENHADLAALLAQHGFAVLVPDLRGHGESDGELDGGEVSDVLCALDTLASRPEVNGRRLGLRGSSMGGRLVLAAAAERRQVRAVVAVCAAEPAVFRARLADAGFVNAARDAGARLDPRALAAQLDGMSLRPILDRLAGRALLFVHAEGDEVVPVNVSRALHEQAREPKRLLLLPDGDHGSAQHDPVAHLATTVWFDEHLRCRP